MDDRDEWKERELGKSGLTTGLDYDNDDDIAVETSLDFRISVI